ncbi:hypothetical protein AAC387_Pa02g4799 [Persea americana]
MSSYLGEIHCARSIFDEIPDPNVFLWNAIIRGYSRHELYDVALKLYCGMRQEGVGSDGFTLSYVLKACNSLPVLKNGREVRAQIFKHGFESKVFVENGLIAMYAKCGLPGCAHWFLMDCVIGLRLEIDDFSMLLIGGTK